MEEDHPETTDSVPYFEIILRTVVTRVHTDAAFLKVRTPVLEILSDTNAAQRLNDLIARANLSKQQFGISIP